MKKQFLKLVLLLCVFSPLAIMGADLNVVTGYGADNTGTNDATQAIQDAIDDAVASNGSDSVYLPAGVYLISSPLVVTGNTNQIYIHGYSSSAVSGTRIVATAQMDCMLHHYGNGNKIYLRRMRFCGDKKADSIIKTGASNDDNTYLPRLDLFTVTGSINAAFVTALKMNSDGINTGKITTLKIENCGAGIVWYGKYNNPIDINIAYFYNNGPAPDGKISLYYFDSFSSVSIYGVDIRDNYIGMSTSLVRVKTAVLDSGYVEGIMKAACCGLGTTNFTIKNYTIKNCLFGISTDLRLTSGPVASSIYGDGVEDNALGQNGHLGGVIENNVIENCVRAWFCQASDVIFRNNTVVGCPSDQTTNTGILRFNASKRVIVGGGNNITGLSNKRIIYATYNVSAPDTSETSLVYHFKADEDYYESTTSADYCEPNSQIIVNP